MDKQDPHISVPPMSAQREEPSMQPLPPRAERKQQPIQPHNEGSSSTILTFVLVTSLIALGSAGGYWITTLQKQIANLQASNLSNQENLDQLRQGLSSTGESATTSLDALSVKNDEQDFEIRKLWDVSNKRNKKQIAANRESAKTLSSKLNTLQKVSAQREKELAQMQANQSNVLDKIKAVESTQSTNNEESKQRLLDQTRLIAATELSASQNRDELQQLNIQLKDLQQQLQKLRQKDTSDAMLSMQLTLDDIQARLSAMEAR